MKSYDQHLHSRHSFDCRSEPADNVRRALATGLAGLTFTEHFDTHPVDWQACVYDDQSYSATIRRLRSEFGRDMFIGKGIEVCYQPERMPFILDFLSRHEFDLVILSVHYFGEHAVHGREHWQNIDVATGTRQYLEHVRRAVRYCADLHEAQGTVFHVLGHLDLVKRYTQRFFQTQAISACRDVIDEILTACLAADMVLEVNTSTLRQGLDEPMPDVTTLLRYAELGGQAVSVGSDAHQAEAVGAGFDHAQAVLHQAGLDRIALFAGGERRLIPVIHHQDTKARRKTE